MTEHLHECLALLNDSTWDGDCICDALRACEQRIRNQDIATHHADLKEAKALLASRDEAWFAGVEAAREAVKHLQHSDDCYYEEGVLCHCEVKRAIAAIDALREETK